MPNTVNRGGVGVKKRQLLQISKPCRKNQRGCVLSTGRLYFLYLNRPMLCIGLAMTLRVICYPYPKDGNLAGKTLYRQGYEL